MGKGILSGGNSSLAATNSKISSHNEDPSAHPQLISTLEDYVDNKISEIPAPDISGEISQHNSDTTAHADIREELSNVESAVSTAQTTANSAQAAAVNAQEVAASKANASHTHTKSQITDFPTSMPASDVSSWAKAASKPTYTWTEITSKPTSFTPASHNQSASTITAGGLAGKVTANGTAMASLGETQLRNIYAGTSDMTAGSTALGTGAIYFVYE